jgi:hypothetical protein
MALETKNQELYITYSFFRRLKCTLNISAKVRTSII